MPFDSVDARRHQTEWAKHVGLPVVEKTKDGLELKLIPPGEFQMGSPEDEPRRKPNETQHLVRIAKPFYMSTYELSFEKARAVLHNDVFNGYITTLSYYNDKQDWPFSKFNWFDAIAFCNRLSEREGLPPYYQLEFSRGKFSSRIYGAKVTVIGGTGYRLPTEAEWEWACRAGTTTATFFGDSLSATQANAGRFDRRLPYTPVGSYAPNAFGLFDMHGNIAEWCFDSYDSQFYMNSPVNDPVCEKINNFKVVRGGDYTGGYHIRSAFRGMQIDKQTGNFGLRIARTPEAK